MKVLLVLEGLVKASNLEGLNLNLVGLVLLGVEEVVEPLVHWGVVVGVEEVVP